MFDISLMVLFLVGVDIGVNGMVYNVECVIQSIQLLAMLGGNPFQAKSRFSKLVLSKIRFNEMGLCSM